MNKSISPYYSLDNIERILGIKRQTLRNVSGEIVSYYHPYKAKQIKKNGKIKTRDIDNPVQQLKFIQKRIVKRILTPYMQTVPTGMIGGVIKKTIRDNAKPHINQEMVVTIDIKDCFPNTRSQAVFRVWKNVVGCGTRQALLLTQLTTFKERLPQGAPTSSAICNLVLLPLYNEILTYAHKNNIAFTLYVDDITLSGKTDHVLKMINFVIERIQKYNYGVRRKKVNIMPANCPQKTTGLQLNVKVSVSRTRLEDLRKKNACYCEPLDCNNTTRATINQGRNTIY